MTKEIELTKQTAVDAFWISLDLTFSYDAKCVCAGNLSFIPIINVAGTIQTACYQTEFPQQGSNESNAINN